jgi:hypothetical protein
MNSAVVWVAIRYRAAARHADIYDVCNADHFRYADLIQLLEQSKSVWNETDGRWKGCLGIAVCSLVSVASPTGSELWEY